MKKILVFLGLVLSLNAADATMEIVKKLDKLPRISVQDASNSLSSSALSLKFFKLLIGDLKVSTNFQVLDKYNLSSYEGDYNSNFLSEEKTDFILRYELSGSEQTEISARIKLINANNSATIAENTYSFQDGSMYPFLAHKIVSNTNANLGMKPLLWMEKFLIFAKHTQKGKSEIVLADYTLTYQKTIVKGGLNVFPKWANEEQSSFYYTSYNTTKPTLYKVDLKTAKRQMIISSQGMLVASDVSKDGSKILLTMAPKDQADIYIYDIYTKKLSQITNYSGIDVNGNFIDNDTRIVFVSDRLGYPNVFAKKIGSRSVEQMVYHGRNNNSASAYDNYIVYSSRETSSEFGKGTFNLYLISTKTDYLRQLTSSGKNLFPRFSVDGENILYIKDFGNQSALGIIRLESNKSFQFPLQIGKFQSLDW